MPIPSSLRFIALALVAVSLSTGCASVPVVQVPAKDSDLYKIPIIVTPKNRSVIPKGERIVIADITGNCGQEVKDALMKRLVDNADYSVITRENLNQVVGEAEQGWAGKFNTATAAKLGNLMGASLWIVGRVSYCDLSPSTDPDNKLRVEFNVFAALQVIDIETGKVLVASASEGTFVPGQKVLLSLKGMSGTKGMRRVGPGADEAPSLAAEQGATVAGEETAPADPSDDPGLQDGQGSTGGDRPGLWGRTRKAFRSMVEGLGDSAAVTHWPTGDDDEAVEEKAMRYARMLAADDMARSFADKFFARPLWAEVLMWDSPYWGYSEAIRLVQLGQCPQALAFIEQVASTELPLMPPPDVSEYLHNYGVTLLCADQPEKAAEKLRSAYRIRRNQSTLEMLGLAARIVEWSLSVEVDREPEVKMLLENESVLTAN